MDTTNILQDRIAPAFRITADDSDITAGILARFKWLRITDESGLQSDMLEIALAPIVLPHLAQTEESDISFLIRVLRDYDALVKPQAGQLIVAKRGEARRSTGENMSPVTVDRSQTSHHRMTKARREKPGTVVAYWHSTRTAKRIEVSVGSGDPVTRIRHYFPTQAAAQGCRAGRTGQARARRTQAVVFDGGRPKLDGRTSANRDGLP